MLEIPVELPERRYLVTIGHGLADLLPELLPPIDRRAVLVLVSSRRVFSLHGRRVAAAFGRSRRVTRVLLPDGERSKSLRSVSRLHDAFLEAGLARDGLVVALGGGLVGDVAGFAAATYMRGVRWVPVPTTLLAMVDSAIGGKVGVNHSRAKNLVGAFHQPGAVVVDPHFLETLPPRQLRSGAYEVLKCAILEDRGLFDAMREAPPGLVGWDPMELERAVASACRIKAEVVEKDEREAGLRRVLNLGHTLGHALETVSRYRRFSHGEAVGWGVIGASWIAHRRGLLSEAGFDSIAAAVDHLGPRPRVSDLAADRILEAVGRDKKREAGRVRFVLPTAIGRVTLKDDVSRAEVRRALGVMAAREARLT